MSEKNSWSKRGLSFDHAAASNYSDATESLQDILNEEVLLCLCSLDDYECLFLDELIELFARNMPPVLTLFYQALMLGDEDKSISLAHKLKGMASNLGARRLTEFLAYVEHHYTLLTTEDRGSYAVRIEDEYRMVTTALNDGWYQKRNLHFNKIKA